MAERKFSTDGNCMRSQKLDKVLTTNSNISASIVDALKKINTIYFDLDNTLIPTRTGDSKACRKLVEVLETQFNFSKEDAVTVTQSFLKAFRRCPDNSQTSLDSWRTFLWREALPNRYKQYAEQIYPKWLQLRYRYLAVPPEYVQILKRFRVGGYQLALISNGPSNAQWEKIKKLNIGQYFDCIFVSSDLPWEKPNPNIFYAACNFLGVKPVQCAMIGDKLETDVKGGQLSGLGVTFWLPLNSSEIDLTDVTYRPHIILKNLIDLSKYFPILNGSGGLGAHASNATASSSLSSSSTSSSSSSLSSNSLTNLQSKRRGSQISCNNSRTTTSTWDSSDHHHPHYYRLYQQQQHQQQQQQRHLSIHNQSSTSGKYRRGGSLPTIECLNSETENSSDSLFT